MPRREPEVEVPIHTESTQRVTQIEVIVEASYANFTRAFESLLGRMPVDALSGLHSLSAQAAREKLASFVGPLDFTLFQKLDHGAIVTVLGERKAVSAGQYLYREGDSAYDFYVVLAGVVEIVVTADGAERVLDRHAAGRFLGELNLLTGQRVFVSARVAESSEVRASRTEDM
jgi:Cyclic nucleotide-binding domain